MSSSDAGLPSDRWPQLPHGTDSVLIALPAEIELAGGWRFSAEPEGGSGAHEADRFQAWLDGGALPHALELRVRRRGDVFEPAGLKGHSQKLSDFFTNAKLPKRARDRWPLLCSGDRIIWVPGYRLAEPFRPGKAAARVVHFALTRHPEELDT